MAANNNDFFSTLEMAQRLDLIRHLIENSEIVPLIRGPSGIGKSRLASRLQQQSPDNWSVCLFEADASMSPDHLLAYISRCIDWTERVGDPLLGLVARFESMREKGLIPVILVDDAQLLPPTSLITLLRLYERQLAGESLVSVVLFADEQIDMLLSTPQLQIMSPQSIQVIDLPPLNREDATAYMHYLLQSEGLPADLELEEGRLTKLYREARGVAGPLRQAILSSISDTGGSHREAGDKKPVWLIPVGIPLLLLIGAGLIFQDEINTLFEPQKPIESSVVKIPEPEPLARIEIPEPEAPAKKETPEPVKAVVPQETVFELEEPAAAPKTLVMEAPVVSVSEEEELVVEPVVPEPEELVQTIEVPLQQLETLKTPIEESIEITSSEKPMESISEPVDTLSAEVETPPVKTSAIPEESPPPESQQKPLDPLRKDEWVLARPATHYTLQLLGVENISALKAFTDRHDLQGKAFFIETQRGGKSWYPLLWGEFPDKQHAIDGMNSLPASLNDKGYWVRPFGEIQELLRKSAGNGR